MIAFKKRKTRFFEIWKKRFLEHCITERL